MRYDDEIAAVPCIGYDEKYEEITQPHRIVIRNEKERCPSCNGRSFEIKEPKVICPRCKGKYFLLAHQASSDDKKNEVAYLCPDCRGHGYKVRICKRCGGEGFMKFNIQYEFILPKIEGELTEANVTITDENGNVTEEKRMIRPVREES